MILKNAIYNSFAKIKKGSTNSHSFLSFFLFLNLLCYIFKCFFPFTECLAYRKIMIYYLKDWKARRFSLSGPAHVVEIILVKYSGEFLMKSGHLLVEVTFPSSSPPSSLCIISPRGKKNLGTDDARFLLLKSRWSTFLFFYIRHELLICPSMDLSFLLFLTYGNSSWNTNCKKELTSLGPSMQFFLFPLKYILFSLQKKGTGNNDQIYSKGLKLNWIPHQRRKTFSY